MMMLQESKPPKTGMTGCRSSSSSNNGRADADNDVNDGDGGDADYNSGAKEGMMV